MLERLKPRYPARVTIILALLITASGAIAQTSTFTYQGRLTDGGTAANGNYDLQFALFDSLNGGAQIGSTQMSSNVPVTAGIFTVQLDFGANTFTGANRFLEIGARPTGSGSFTVLSPRQPVTSTPYAVRSASAASADTATTATSATNATNSSQLGGVAAANYVQTNDSRLSDARSPTPGSPNYIQNTSSQQAASNLNISGNGTAAGTLSANIVNATMQYNIGGNRVLSLAGSNNTFAGLNAGSANTTGTSNSFFGRSAGNNNTTGASNSFFGSNAGFLNTTGGKNSFVGSLAGASNTTGGDNTFVGRSAGAANATASGNSFFGSSAGASNTEGDNNSFFGGSAGNANTTGFGNSFFGNSAGFFNTTGTQNSFFGVNAGFLNTTGISNSFFGIFAGNANTTGSDNTIIGHNADVGGGNLSFATAIGAGAIVSDSNSIVLGRADGSDAVRIPGAVLIDGSLVVKTLGTANTSAQICRNTADRLSPCSSSLRYKTDVKTFLGGFDIVNRLRPISFTWKEGGMRDVGLGAEEVEQVAPLLIFRNDKGEIEGVKYNQLTAVFINAFKEQQAQIKQQQEQLKHQQAALSAQQQQLDALRKLVCRSHRRAVVCR